MDWKIVPARDAIGEISPYLAIQREAHVPVRPPGHRRHGPTVDLGFDELGPGRYNYRPGARWSVAIDSTTVSGWQC